MYLYQIYDNGSALPGYYSIREAAEIINATDKSTVSYYARSGRTYKKRWQIKRFKQDRDGVLEEAERKDIKRRLKKAEKAERDSQTGISEEADKRKRRREIKKRLRQLEIDRCGASIWLGYLQFANEFLRGGHRNGRDNEAFKEAAE